jgi:hypothetical protein
MTRSQASICHIQMECTSSIIARRSPRSVVDAERTTKPLRRIEKVQSTLIRSQTSRMPFAPAGAVTGIGSLPLTSLTSVIGAVAEFSAEIPFWPQLPRVSEAESVIGHGLGIVAGMIEPRSEGYGYRVKESRIDSLLETLHRSSGELTATNATGFVPSSVSGNGLHSTHPKGKPTIVA